MDVDGEQHVGALHPRGIIACPASVEDQSHRCSAFDRDSRARIDQLIDAGVVGSDHGGGVLDGRGPGGVCEVEQHGAVAGAAVLRPHGRALPGGRDGTTSRSGWTRAAASAASTR